MAKKVKDPDAKRLQKLRSALRNVWQYDPLRKAVIKAAIIAIPGVKDGFMCPLCQKGWPIQLATVDHEPELGSFTLSTIGDWTHRLFYGPQRAICKPCHARKPKGKKKSV
jgi:hypothetical protein